MQGDAEDLRAQMKAVRKKEREDRKWSGRHRIAAIVTAAVALLAVLAALSLLRAEAEGPKHKALDSTPATGIAVVHALL